MISELPKKTLWAAEKDNCNTWQSLRYACIGSAGISVMTGNTANLLLWLAPYCAAFVLTHGTALYCNM